VRVLALIVEPPDPAISGSRVRNRFLWPALRKSGVEVRILGLDRKGREGAVGELADAEYFPLRRESWPNRARHAALYSYHQWPWSPQLKDAVDQAVEKWRPDVVHAEQLRMASYLPALRGQPASCIQTLTLHNVESRLLRQTGSAAHGGLRHVIEPLHRLNLDRFEARAVTNVDRAFAYSELDRREYQARFPGVHWCATRGGVDTVGIQPAPAPGRGVLLLGSLAYAPNVRGLEWFVENVLPRLGELPVTVAGSGADVRLRQWLGALPVRFVDTPLELRSLYMDHAICAVPVHEGGGTRGKILEALAYGRPVVSTPKGAEGLELAEGEGLTVVTSAEAFAQSLLELSTDPAACAAMAQRGRTAVERRYDWSVVAENMLREWQECLPATACETVIR